MPDNSTLNLLNAFIIAHTKIIRHQSVIADTDLAELFETDVETIRRLTETSLSKFKDESLFILTNEEKILVPDVQFAFSDAGIFTLAGLIKTKRAISIYVKMIELLVNRLQNKAYDIATNYHTNT